MAAAGAAGARRPRGAKAAAHAASRHRPTPWVNLRGRLEAAVAQSTDATSQACLRAERAALLARLGHQQQARAELCVLRALEMQRPSPRLNAWLCLAEGLADYFDDLHTAARARIHDAYTFSLPARDAALHALAAAWLAHIDYMRRDVKGMVRYAAQALHLAGADDHAARSRACLVVAQAWHSAGRFDTAMPWYRNARLHASQVGDDATQLAVMHNMAWRRAHELREQVVFGDAGVDVARQVLLGAESTERFCTSVATGGLLLGLLPLMRAMVLTLVGEPAQALALFDAELPRLPPGLKWLEPGLRADVAWCHLQLGEHAAARAACEAALAAIDPSQPPGERALAQALAARVLQGLGQVQQADPWRRRADAALREHREYQATLARELERGLKGLAA